MPPVLPRKRLRSDSPKHEPPPKRPRPARNPPPRRKKESVFETLDAPTTPLRSLSQTRQFLDQREDESSELSESESSSDDFEDVPIAGNKAKANGKQKARDVVEEESEDEEWEDALGVKHTKYDDEPAPTISGDLEFTLSAPVPTAFVSNPDGKKGPSKIQRHIRNLTHCTHVQLLMFHNLIRNAWIQDRTVQRILVESMPVGCWKEMGRYWRDAGISDGPKRVVEGAQMKQVQENEQGGSWKASGKKGVQIFESPKSKDISTTPKSKAKPSKANIKDKQNSERNQRDWGATSGRLEPNTPNLSAGDPLLRLMKYLSAYWKAKFKITAPCLRKRGYLSPSTLEAEIRAWREDGSDPDAFGERVESLEAFRERAHNCEGSRDVGQQLFTALLRGLGIEARMVASLQPAGFGWSQAEEGKPKDLTNLSTAPKDQPSHPKGNARVADGSRDAPLDLSDSDISDLSSAVSVSSDSEIDKKIPKKPSKGRKYGDDLPNPTYWTEAISTLTHTPIAVSPIPRTVVATSSMPEQLLDFYCRGASADKAKQVFAYLIAFSSDGTAKDVTTRYLPRHQWPGRTKGFRMPVEKIPIRNKHGKVKRWEEWDWFKSILRLYARPHNARQPWDEVEDEGDLVPAQPAKPKDMDEEGGKETLQGYKNSAEYVLERHLRREEAIQPGAKIVRYFTTGKGSKEKQEPVYRRRDIVTCKSVESWHKEGRAVKEGEQPLKFVPIRAVTVVRKREIEEREREEGGKVKQGLYSQAQTDWIIPEPIEDGKIPRNAFGNIDVYVPTMVPRGAVHIPLKGTARVCRKLNIDYAEACTGFEFGKQRAVPILTGVVVAAENEALVIDAWEADQAEKARKEYEKKQKLVLGTWKRFFLGLRIVQRMKREYGDEDAGMENYNTQDEPSKKSEWEVFQGHEDFEGGFLRDEPNAAEEPLHANETMPHAGEEMAGGFLLSSQEEPSAHGTELTIDHGDDVLPNLRRSIAKNRTQTPISLHSVHRKEQRKEDESTSADDNVATEEESTPIPPPSRRSRGTARPLGRANNRAGRPSSPSSPNHSAAEASSRVSNSSPSNVSDHEDSADPSEPATPPRPSRGKDRAPSPTPIAGRLPRRQAARKGDARLKSHFFAHGEDEETDFTDLSPRKKGGDGRGRGRGRRGRGK